MIFKGRIEKFSSLNLKSLWGRKGPSKQIRINWYFKLSVLLEAGVDINESLFLSSDQEMIEDWLEKIINRLNEGISLDSALALEYFPTRELSMIRLGQETGSLSVVLSRLAMEGQKELDTRSQIISALVYPTIVLVASLLAVIFLLAFMVPLFTDIFQRTGGDLPFLTDLVISASDHIHWLILVPTLTMISIFLLFKFGWRSKQYRIRIEKLRCSVSINWPIYHSRTFNSIFLSIIPTAQFRYAAAGSIGQPFRYLFTEIV